MPRGADVWFDSHCHLHDCEQADTVELVERALAAGVTGMVIPGVDVASSLRALALAVEYGLWAAAGVHPSESKYFDDAWAAAVDDLLEHERVAAVGETGLDFHWDSSFVAQQKRAFAAHIRLARKHDKALVIHTRASVDAALDMLEEHGPAGAVFHCWSGDQAQLRRALDLDAYISFAGNVTFKNAGALRDVVALVPEDRLLVETDSPYLAPVPHRGRPNEPAHVTIVGAAVAQLLGMAEQDLAQLTSDNARVLFGLP